MSVPSETTSLRRTVYWLLIAIGLGAVLGRILAVDSVDRRGLPDANLKKVLAEKKDELQRQGVDGVALQEALDRERAQAMIRLGVRRPFLSGNDRSRWDSVRALVDPEMRVDGAPYAIDRVIQEPGWDTIDMVQHNGHLYSSKPPLMATLMAVPYWIIYNGSRLSIIGHPLSLGEQPYVVGRLLLILINGGLLLLYFAAIARLVERLGTTDWGRVFVMATAVFGTFLTTFAVVINNHLAAAAAAAWLVEILVRIWLDGDRRASTFAWAGLAASMLAANELPALALACAAGLVLLWKAPRTAIIASLPTALVVMAAFFATNWIAVGSLKPAYMHRSGADNWYDYSYQRNGRTIESYWKNPAGIDKGEPRADVYTLNVLVGHHGILSLTPVWLLSLCGAMHWLGRRSQWPLRLFTLLVGGVTLVCMTFYLFWPTVDRNYGGTSSGFRWVFWMAPMWLALMLPAADSAGRYRWARVVALLLLALSVLSASYPTWNPWTHPWIMDYLVYMGWA